MSNDDRSRRVWRLLERGWTSARVLKDAIQQVRGRVDEARVRLSDEVVSRIAGQPVRTQPTLERDDPLRDGVASETPPPVPSRPDPSVQAEIMRAADDVGDDAVMSEAQRSAPPSNPGVLSAPTAASSAAPEAVSQPSSSEPPPTTEGARPTGPIFVRPPALTADDMSPPDTESPKRSMTPNPRADLPPPMDAAPTPSPTMPTPGPSAPPGDGRPWSELVEPAEARQATTANGAAPTPTADTVSPPGLPLEDGEIVALARDAEWLFIYWEIDAPGLAASAGVGADDRGTGFVGGDVQFWLRVVQPNGAGRVHESSAAVPSGRRYVRVPFADSSYHAELWVRGEGREVLLARSAPAATPPALPRPVGLAAMVSSARQVEVLNAAWDLSQVPQLAAAPKAHAVVEAPVSTPAMASEAGLASAMAPSGSEARLTAAEALAAAGWAAPLLEPGSAGRLDGSEGRLDGSEGRFGGSEGRLGGSEGRLGGIDPTGETP